MKTVESLPSYDLPREELTPLKAFKSPISCHTCKEVLLNASGSLTGEYWLNTKEAANYLRLSVAELRNKSSNGKIPYYKLGRSNRYCKSELEALLLKNKRGQHEYKV